MLSGVTLGNGLQIRYEGLPYRWRQSTTLTRIHIMLTNLHAADRDQVMGTPRLCRYTLALTMAVALSQEAAAADHYVSPTGNDALAVSSLSAPWKTIGKAARSVNAGDTVHVRAGLYLERPNLSRSGTESNPIVYKNYNGEKVIIDGQQDPQGTERNYTSIVNISGDYITFDGFECRNGGFGIYSGGYAPKIFRSIVHDTNLQAICFQRRGLQNAELRWSTIYNGGMINVNGRNRGLAIGWPNIVSFCGGYNDASYVNDGCVMADNVLYNSWGEGFGAFSAKNVLMERNVAYNMWQCCYYIQNVINATVRNNIAYYDVSAANPTTQTGGLMHGILFADEYNGLHTLNSNFTFANNLIYGGGMGFNSWTSMRGAPVTLCNNVVVGQTQRNISLDAVGSSLAFKNNIMLNSAGRTLATLPNGASISNNCWSGGNGRPSNAVSAGDVLADPLLTGGSTLAGMLVHDYFRPRIGSPVYGKGVQIAGITTDFTERALPPYSIGAFAVAPNTAPVATAQSVTTSAGTAKAITLAGTDADGNALTYAIVANPAHGTVTGSGASRTYTPAGGYSGADSFTFTVSDGTATSAAATVSISVTASGNTAPAVGSATASPATVTATTTALSATASDDAGEAGLTYTWSASPATVSFSRNGSNAAKASTATFTAAGTYVLTITARDAGGLSGTRTVTVVVAATPTSLVISPATANVASGASLNLTATVKDQFQAVIASPALTWTVVSGGGSVGANGVYAAPSAIGTSTVRAVSGAASATTTLTVGSTSGGTVGGDSGGSAGGGCGSGALGLLLLVGLGALGLCNPQRNRAC
jgi:hypothetical protein